MRFQATLDLPLEFRFGDLEGVDLRSTERHQESRPTHPGDLGGFALRDKLLSVPLDGRRQSNSSGEFLIRTAEHLGQVIGNFQHYGLHPGPSFIDAGIVWPHLAREQVGHPCRSGSA
jgi:hypothetical protein